MEDHAQENQHQKNFANYMHEIPETPTRNPGVHGVVEDGKVDVQAVGLLGC
jgi:hypothetical protein